MKLKIVKKPTIQELVQQSDCEVTSVIIDEAEIVMWTTTLI